MFARPTLTAALIASLSLLGACSDDEKDPETSPTNDTSSPATEQRTDCEAEVELDGRKVKGGWSGEAFVITENRSGPAQYRTSKGSTSLAVFAEESEDDPAFAVLKVKDASYTASPGDKDTLEVDPEGAGAEIDAEFSGMGGVPPVQVTATITC